METHFNAFISYRHHPEDIAAAEQIHRALERYKAPKGIREKTKPITRIFRDKDELPITSNLTDDITSALENSDFLIVICSTHTRESTWVQREIETFLKTHDRSKVLTLLVNGEPYDTIPEILLHEEVENPISGEKHTVDIEPLSCDWRLKKNRREEFLRLAAALLGCRYDDLRQRHRQYRTRRMIAIFSAALAISLCLTAYFIYSGMQIRRANEKLEAANVEIQNNLEQSLRNQSQYLAAASKERLEAGDRLTALHLALAALPQEGGDRPYLAQAEMALASALGLYDPAEEIAAVGTLSPDALVTDVQVTEDGSYAAVLDARNRITIWDTHTFKQIGTIEPKDSINRQSFTSDGTVLLEMSLEISCHDVQGKLLWSTEKTGGILLQEQTLLMLDGKKLYMIDHKTGERLDTLRMKTEAGSILAANENAVIVKNTTEGAVHMVSRADGKAVLLWKSDGYAGKAAFTEEGNVLLMGFEELSMNGDYGTFQLYSPQTADIFCYDGASGEILWHTQLTSYRYCATDTLTSIPGQALVLCQYGNTFMVLDALTGEVRSEIDTGANPVIVKAFEDCVKGLLEDGTFFTYDFAEHSCMTSILMEGGLEQAVYADGYFAYRSLDMKVTVYRPLSDKSAQPVCEGEEMDLSICQSLHRGERIVIQTYDEILMFDLAENRLSWRYAPESTFSDKLLGISNDGKSLWVSVRDDGLLRIDMDSGEETRLKLPSENLWSATSFFYDGEKICYTSNDSEQLYFVTYHPEQNLTSKYVLGERTSKAQIITVCEDYAVIQAEGTVWLLDTASEEVEILAREVSATARAACDGEQTAVAIGNRIIFANSLFSDISLGEKQAVSCCFYGSELLVLCDDGVLYRYDALGNPLSRTTLNLFDSFYNNAKHDDAKGVQWYFTADGELILNLYGAGNIISCEQWERRAYILYMLCYLPERDAMLMHTRTAGMNCFKRLSTQEVIARAIDELDGFELSQEQKKSYGIE